MNDTNRSDESHFDEEPELRIGEEQAWRHFCRTGCIIPGYANVVARRLKERRERDR